MRYISTLLHDVTKEETLMLIKAARHISGRPDYGVISVTSSNADRTADLMNPIMFVKTTATR